MKTPICDFVKAYCEKGQLRLHMPGHKGYPILGAEPYDITEICGADSLYEASGIIKESEENAASLFGTAATFYSTEGSSLGIRAMLYLALLYGRQKGKENRIVAGRNAHKTFVTASGLLGFDISWLYPAEEDSYLSCKVEEEALEEILVKTNPSAVYLTNPDYLGNQMDIEAVARICKKRDTLLLVDNAHGAYLKFLPISRHPMDLGADMCCDSAHKTLPVLTGGAYLHIGKGAPELLKERAKGALALFGSTSPSYLILQSLDWANAYLYNGFAEKLKPFLKRAEVLKTDLQEQGFELIGKEPMKLTIRTKPYGYCGTEFAEILAEKGIECEFADPDYVVMMLSCEIGEEGLEQIRAMLSTVERRAALTEEPPRLRPSEPIYTVREVLFAEQETIPAAESEGRILAELNVGCPPAVPIVVCGERISSEAVRLFEYYQIHHCAVVKMDGI